MGQAAGLLTDFQVHDPRCGQEGQLNVAQLEEYGIILPVSPADFEKLASAVYGNNWQSALARRVGVDARSVRHRKAGDRRIPDWLEWAIGILERHEDER
jgi:hypothetical protein